MTQPTAEDAYSLAIDVMQRLDRHEETCGERYARIEQNQRDARDERRDMHKENKDRIDRLYNRAWAIAGIIILGQMSVIVGVIAFALTKVFQ